MTGRLFSDAQLVSHERRLFRLWHLARQVSPWGWRQLGKEMNVTWSGVVLRGEVDDDGDTSFGLQLFGGPLVHCEVDPADLDRLRSVLRQLRHGGRAIVSGRPVADSGHDHQIELHPVTAIVVPGTNPQLTDEDVA